jgi:F0F1-type ATP synthase assembly protein I
MEEKLEEPIEEEPEKEAKPEVKEKFNFRKWLKGKNRKEYIENISFVIIVISGILVALGIGIGSFIQGTILIASLGSFFVMVGIVIYIISQFIEAEHG